MGVYSSLCVRRNVALQALAERKWGHLSDDALGDKLDKHVEHALHNVVVSEREFSPDDEARLLSVVERARGCGCR